MTLDQFAREHPDAMVAEGFEGAILGICHRFGQEPTICYDYDACIEILMERGMSRQEADEFFGRYLLGAWVGEHTPAYVRVISSRPVQAEPQPA